MNNNLYALIVEGAAEEGILNVLIEKNLLKFPISEIYMEKVIRVRSATKFQKSFLNQGLGNTKLIIYRILDSRKEQFNLSKAYRRKVDKIIELYTRPEIEMLFIVYHHDYQKYTTKFKSIMKPSTFAHQNYSDVKNLKAKNDVYDFWIQRPAALVAAIKDFAKFTSDPYDTTLASILK